MVRQNAHRLLLYCFKSIVLLLIPFSAAAATPGLCKQRPSSRSSAKELNLRYTQRVRTEMAGVPMQMPSQSTTLYIKGKRQRTDDEQRLLATIHQCDLERYVYLNLQNKTCLVQTSKPTDGTAPSGPAAPNRADREKPAPEAKPRKGGVVVIEGEITDTGERKQMYGLQARHVISKQVIDSPSDACSPGHMEMTQEMWLVDLPRWTCENREKPKPSYVPMRAARPDCEDTYRTRFKGNASLMEGFPLYNKQTMVTHGQTVTMIHEVTDLSLAELDPALFELPADCREMKDAQTFWAGVRNPGGFSVSDAMKTAREAGEREAFSGVEKPAKGAGMLRVGVTVKNSAGAILDVPQLRHDMVDTIDRQGGSTIDAVDLVATARPELDAEAANKQVDYILQVDLREARASAGRKLGGILGRAAGVEVADKTSAKLDYQWIERTKMETVGTRALSDNVSAPVPQAMEQFCRKSAEQALAELLRIIKK